jgi:diaminopropionate ammonia-lyase
MASSSAGVPVKAPDPVQTMMAGLECGEVSPLAWQILRLGVDVFLTVPDEVTAPTMRLLATAPFQDQAIRAGESAIAGLAALLCVAKRHDLKASLELGPDSQVLVLGTEGPTDPSIFRELTGLQIE